MHRLFKIALLTLLACFIVLAIAWVARRAGERYLATIERINHLEAVVQDLRGNAHPKWRVREGRFSINSKDGLLDTNLTTLHLVSNSKELLRFEDFIWKEPGHIVTAWVSDWTPRSEMEKFEQFSVSSSKTNSNRFEVLAQLKPGESAAMKFTLTFIVE